MKTQIPLSKAMGRTITGVVKSNTNSQTLIYFGEEFICLGVDRGWDPVDEEIDNQEIDLDSWNLSQLVKAGIMSSSEARSIEERNRSKAEALKEHRERLQYERLKAKFETKPQ